MALTTKIQTIITETVAPNGTFFFTSQFNANVYSLNGDYSVNPMIVLDNELPKDPIEIKKNNNIQKLTRIMIWFLRKCTLDATPAHLNTIQVAMEAMADLTAVKIYQLDEVRPVGNQQYKINPVFHAFGKNMTGVVMEMKVNENVVISWDPPEED